MWNALRWLLATILVIVSVDVASGETPSPLGNKVEDFQLKDFRGKQHQLSDLDDKKVVVLAFLGTECPLAKLYAPRLTQLCEEFESQGVAFMGINANTQDSLTEIANYVKTHEIDFPIVKDVGNRVADQLAAVRTPEVFVLDENRVIRYWGRIDDQYGVGFIREKPTRQDLRIAMTELLAGKEISQPLATSVGCYIGRLREASDNAKVTYSNQISRLLQKRCVECHRDGEIAPFALQDYDEVVGWAETILEVVEDRRMPPWHANPAHGDFANDRVLSDDEKQLLADWVEAGAPEGDPSQLPGPLTFSGGWQLPKAPDLVVGMGERPFEVQAEGTVRYKYFTVDPGFQEDKWIKALEVVPGNRAVVHHVLVFAIPEGSDARATGGGVNGFLAGYVPGLRAEPFPSGMAKRIPAGSKLLFQMHYTPIGSVQQDLSKIGFVFTDESDVTHEVKTISAFQRFFTIPPRDPNYEVTTRTRVREDSQLLAMMPHMHLRGKSFRYQIRYPGSDEWEILLDVPNYDFNWQTNYRLSNPMPLPKDSFIKCVAHFDNSIENLSNPNPRDRVKWGEQTWQEMMIGYFEVAEPYDPDAQSSIVLSRRETAEQYILQLDNDDDGQLQVKELPFRFRIMFGGSDKDGDGVISIDELIGAFGRRLR